ncbi:MAG: hypothetical protein KGI29_01410 [Pseudomonadota bacterium]|nr:hypothetical protein [Pseudomonadota bacterium]MDE3037252.1 hypothetical protein [Pseudomonadota bacterium]
MARLILEASNAPFSGTGKPDDAIGILSRRFHYQ